jgi:hypothetical protein
LKEIYNIAKPKFTSEFKPIDTFYGMP